MLKFIPEEKEFELSLMPNIDDTNQSIIEVLRTNSNDNNEIDVVCLPRIIKDILSDYFGGFSTSSEGYYISRGKSDFYYANSDKSTIYSADDDDYYSMDDLEDNEDFIKYTDITYHAPLNIYNLADRYNLVFKTRVNQGFIQFYNIGIKKVDPLYKKGDNKSDILSLYDQSEKLLITIEKYKAEIERKNENIIWDEEARKMYMKNKIVS